MRLLCIKGHDVQIDQIVYLRKLQLSKKKSCLKKGRIHIKLPLLHGKKNGCKNNKCRRIHLNVHMCKKKKN